MGFPKKVRDAALVASARYCCVCHRITGLNIEVHHIIPQEQQGKDTLDNAIALCFDCHADAGHYFAKHPKEQGSRQKSCACIGIAGMGSSKMVR